ncbi:MAG: glycolate oxidase subunit GlcF [Gammaproteobacteria bacterium]|nr:glycolate oxidase subunit GlcF [Gammaproteobacteria bacterium]MBU1601302.1 glycolate oxidase subunit GlcF [Gammaproteobacteria bacterium]MBU2433883.1 glycolate oxidase subunit GlcF [Gammaproteobacteria bacterium]MBU2450599.1 glycolate oxidase subunit GlcF [Gammaproteobacteria bacterium]
MDTKLTAELRATHAGQIAEEILRKCVHCGFCTATCPTYQLLGDELDGPRGRIYLIKQVLEGKDVSEKTRTHLDRCLTCRSCETTCPSGVKYSHLLDVGRAVVEAKLPRRFADRVTRALLRTVLPNPALFGPAIAVGRAVRPLLPTSLADKLPPAQPSGAPWPKAAGHARRMLTLAGCVQPSLAPNINAATARVFDKLGIELFEEAKAGCCGAVRFHLNDHETAKNDMRRNIDAWWPHVEAGVEAIVVTASGCGVQVRDYGHILADDTVYAEKAAKISALCRDPSEILAGEKAALLPSLAARQDERGKLAFHSPCTLQHGLQIRGSIELLLQAAGYELTPVADSHLCCGSAGTYSVLQPELANKLRDDKLAALNAGGPALAATANIGCLTHLQAGSTLPVRHWIELIDEAMA